MNILAIETSAAVGSVAACRADKPLAEGTLGPGMAHGRLLLPLIDQVVSQAGWERRGDIELVAVDVGPGSFTGLRVGIVCAKTLAQLLKIPLVAVCSFDAMAHNAPRNAAHVLTVLDAKRGDVYAAAYTRNGNTLQRTHEPRVMRPEEAAAMTAGKAVVLGDGLRRHAEALCAPGHEGAPEEAWCVRAVIVAMIALRRFESGEQDDPLGVEPLYLRRPVPEERRLARERGAS